MAGGKTVARKEGLSVLGIPVSVSDIGKGIVCTDENACDGPLIRIHCVDCDTIYDDVNNNCAHAPACIRESVPEGGTLNIECIIFPNKKVQEVFVAVIDSVEIEGTYVFHLYYEGSEVGMSPVKYHLYVGDSFLQWYGYHQEELWYNGNYTYTVEDPTGAIIKTQNFKVSGAQLVPTPTPTPTGTPSPETYLNCIFLRILTGELTPRITTGDPIPRITCLNEAGILKI